MTILNTDHISKQRSKLAIPAELGWGLLSKKVFGRLQTRAFQKALSRAYAGFAAHHPQWVDSFFDDYFVTHTAKPLLSGYLQPSPPNLPSPGELASLWADQFRANDPARKYTAKATLIAADFLGRLEAELQEHAVFRIGRQ